MTNKYQISIFKSQNLSFCDLFAESRALAYRSYFNLIGLSLPCAENPGLWITNMRSRITRMDPPNKSQDDNPFFLFIMLKNSAKTQN